MSSKKKRPQMKLDLGGTSATKKRRRLQLAGEQQQQSDGNPPDISVPILTTPDVQMLKLSSPEMAKFLNAPSGELLATPTPGGSLVVPTPTCPAAVPNVAAEREIYAKGFQIALEKEEKASSPKAPSASLKKEIISPIVDPKMQEKIKLDRKRARNRMAASRCRQKKLDKISVLDAKVKELKEENAKLDEVASRLRSSVGQLKAELALHEERGCPVSPVANNEKDAVSEAVSVSRKGRRRKPKKK